MHLCTACFDLLVLFVLLPTKGSQTLTMYILSPSPLQACTQAADFTLEMADLGQKLSS